MADRVQLARQLTHAATVVAYKGLPLDWLLRQAARELLDLPEDVPDHHCAGCRAELTQPSRGRRRKWCGEACRSRARRR